MPSADWLKAWQLQKYKFVALVSHKFATFVHLSHIHLHEQYNRSISPIIRAEAEFENFTFLGLLIN